MTTADRSGERAHRRPGAGLRFTVSQYDHMIETGELIGVEGRKLQLVRGEVLYMSPSSARHDDVVYLLTTWAYTHVDDIDPPVEVSIQLSIALPEQSSVISPDMAFIVKQSYATRRPTPQDTHLLIEVIDKSYVQSREAKAALYAEANISEFWAVDVPSRTLIAHRDPKAGSYQSVQTFSGQQTVEPIELPGCLFRLKRCFGRWREPAG